MSSYIYHKNENFILKKEFHCILIIVTLSINFKVKWIESLIFFLVFNFLFNSENFINWVETFFCRDQKIFLLTLKAYKLYDNIPSNSKMFVHIFKKFICLMKVIEKQKWSGGGKRPFPPPDTLYLHIRQDLFRLEYNLLENDKKRTFL